MSECELHADLGGKGDAYGRDGAEKVAESASGNKQLLAVGDWHGARWRGTKRGDVGEIVHRNGQSTDIADVVVSGIVAIEEVEELEEGHERPALVELDRSAHPQIGLNVGRAAELVEPRLHAIDHHAIAGGARPSERPRRRSLRAGTP